MRIALAQLLKTKMPYSTSEKIDVSDELVGLEDILDSSIADVDYVFSRIDEQTYLVKIKIRVDLVLEGPVSLKHFTKEVLVETEEIFSKYDYNDDFFEIDGQTIDTKEAVVTNILLAKPVRIDDEEYIDDEDDFEEDDQEEYINPAFASLKDLF